MSRDARNVVILLGVVAALVVVLLVTSAHKGDQAVDAVKTVQEKVSTVQQDAADARTTATDAATTNAATKTTAERADRRSKGTVRFLQGRQGSPGINGVDGRLTEVLTDRLPAALELACGGSCDGRPGADGKDGRDAPAVTQEMVDLAMAHYCDAHNGCQGPPGAASTVPGPQGVQGDPGPQGVPGADSQVPGPQGPQGADGVTTTVLVPCVGPGDPIPACP